MYPSPTDAESTGANGLPSTAGTAAEGAAVLAEPRLRLIPQHDSHTLMSSQRKAALTWDGRPLSSCLQPASATSSMLSPVLAWDSAQIVSHSFGDWRDIFIQDVDPGCQAPKPNAPELSAYPRSPTSFV